MVDVPQTFVFSYSYELPFGPGKPFFGDFSSNLVRQLAGGWSLNGITTFQSGQPLFVTVASDLLNNNGGSNPADITCTSVSTPKLINQWFDPTCFAAPAPYTFGNSGVGHVRGPGINNWDLSVAKDSKLHENIRLRFEAAFFNLANSAHFSNPNTTFATAGFATISSDRLPPRLIQLGAKISF